MDSLRLGILTKVVGWLLGLPIVAIATSADAAQLAAPKLMMPEKAYAVPKSELLEKESPAKIADNSDPLLEEAKRLSNEGADLLFDQARYADALELFERALTIRREISDRPGEAIVLGYIARAHSEMGEYSKALDYYQQSLVIRQEIGDRKGEGIMLNNMGFNYVRIGDYEQALDHFDRSLAIREDINDRNGISSTLNNIGGVHDDLGNYPKALDYYEQSLTMFTVLEDRDGVAMMLNNVGGIHSSLGDYSLALDYYEQSLAIREELEDRRGIARMLNNIGYLYSQLSDPDRALDYYQRSLAIRKALGDRDGIANAFDNIGGIFTDFGDYEKALEYRKKALGIYEEIRSPRDVGRVLNNIGVIHDSLGEYRKALDYYERSLTISEQTNDISGTALNLHNIAGSYADLGQYTRALDYYQRALKIREEMGERYGVSLTLHSTGSVYGDLGEYETSLSYYKRALSIQEEIGTRLEAGNSLNSIGVIYAKLGDKDAALIYYEQALAIQEAINDKVGISYSLHNIASIYHARDEYAEALKYYEQSLVLGQEIGDQIGVAGTLNSIGGVYLGLEEYTQALDYYEQALQIREEIGDRSGVANSLNNIGHLYSELDDDPKALEYYERSLAIAEELGERSRQALMLSNIGTLLANQDQTELSIIFLKQAVNKYEVIRKSLATLEDSLQTSYTDSISETYRDLADLLLQQDRILEAQRVLDLLKVQELDDYLRNVRGNARTASGINYFQPEQEILNRYNELQSSVIDTGKRLAQLNQQSAATELTSDEQSEWTRLNNLRKDLLRQFQEFPNSPDIQPYLETLAQVEGTIDINDIRQLSDELEQLNAVLIYPLVLDDRIELVINTADSPPLRRTVENVEREDLNAAINAFREALDDPFSDAKTPAYQLYQWLIEPLEQDLADAGVDTILYAPDGPLRYVPLAALYDSADPDNGQWLVERFKVNNITARSLQEMDAQPATEPSILAGAFADASLSYPVPVGSDVLEFSGLPFAGVEVATLAETLENTRTYLDQDFTLATFEPKLNEFNVLHFATHASLVAEDVGQSFILFGDGDPVTLEEISLWELNDVDLVVLSACETGLGGFDNSGVQILGLGYQFQSAGARAVIASLWQVDDGGTQLLMNAFYQALGNGYSKVEALQRSQQALIQDDLSLVGEARASVGPDPR